MTFENFSQLFLRNFLAQVFDENVVELRFRRASFRSSLKRTDVDNLIVHFHAVHLLDCFLRRCLGIELDKAVPFRVTLAIRGNLCGNNVTELRERISQPDGINVLVQVLDEDVPTPDF